MATDYKQYNYNATYSGGSFASQACGPTSCADLLNVSPLTTAQWLTNNGYAVKGRGTNWFGIAPCLSAFGGGGKMLNSTSVLGQRTHPVFDAWQKVIQSGCMGILLMGNGVSNYWTNSGHFVAVVGYKDGKYLVYDPASVTRTGYHAFSDFAGNNKICYTSTLKWGAPAPVTTYSFKADQIQYNSTGKLVLLLQKILQQRNIYRGALDGSYGSQTVSAVKTYQTWISTHGGSLKVDGVCGPATWTSILGISGDPKVLKEIKFGDFSIYTLLLQEILWSDGFYHGAVDKSYGPGTEAAVRAFQKHKNIAQDGVCGPTTWRNLIGL